MKIYEAYELAVRTGMSADPRPDSEVRKVLDDARETYEKLPEDRKELFDPERLWNPYSDCRFSVMADEAREMEAERMMWGIDIGSAEVLLADRLRERGEKVSALVAHHPIGTARTCFPEGMWMRSSCHVRPSSSATRKCHSRHCSSVASRFLNPTSLTPSCEAISATAAKLAPTLTVGE